MTFPFIRFIEPEISLHWHFYLKSHFPEKSTRSIIQCRAGNKRSYSAQTIEFNLLPGTKNRNANPERASALAHWPHLS